MIDSFIDEKDHDFNIDDDLFLAICKILEDVSRPVLLTISAKYPYLVILISFF